MIRSRSLVPMVAMAGLALGALGCLDAADGRARRDAEVGRAAVAGMSVLVDEGLAAVRRIAPGELHLWAGAPRVALEVTVPAGTGPFTLFVENAVSDATLAVVGAPIRAAIDTQIVTEKRWQITPPTEGGTLRFVIAPPDVDTPGPWRFAAFADVQEAIDGVQDIYERMNADAQLRFVVMSGDLTRRGSAPELERFQREMKRLNVPIYATLGNHELGTRDDIFHDYFGRGNFRFRFKGVQFTMLDSASATIAPPVYGWLDRWLDEAREQVHLVLMHIPPLDPVGTRNGAFASRAEANKLLARLAAGRVDMTIYGHVHSFYAYANAGIPAYITGGGGAIPERMEGIGRHYLAIDVDPVRGLLQPAVVRVDRK
jgi:predicted phosphodiesterase